MLHLQEIAVHGLKMAPYLSDMRKAADFLDWWDHMEVFAVQTVWDREPIPIPSGIEPGWVVHLLQESAPGLGVLHGQKGWEIRVRDPGFMGGYLLPHANHRAPEAVKLLIDFREKWTSTFHFLDAFREEHGVDMADRLGPFAAPVRLLERYHEEINPENWGIPF